jgi:hypothetical protein
MKIILFEQNGAVIPYSEAPLTKRKAIYISIVNKELVITGMQVSTLLDEFEIEEFVESKSFEWFEHILKQVPKDRLDDKPSTAYFTLFLHFLDESIELGKINILKEWAYFDNNDELIMSIIDSKEVMQPLLSHFFSNLKNVLNIIDTFNDIPEYRKPKPFGGFSLN